MKLDSNKGFMNFIVIIVVLVLIFSLLKVNLRGYIDSDPDTALKGNTELIVQMLKIIWYDYIKGQLWLSGANMYDLFLKESS